MIWVKEGCIFKCGKHVKLKLFLSVLGAVYLIYHKLIAKTIIWDNFILRDGELLKTGLVLFFLQVSRRREHATCIKITVGRLDAINVESDLSLHVADKTVSDGDLAKSTFSPLLHLIIFFLWLSAGLV